MIVARVVRRARRIRARKRIDPSTGTQTSLARIETRTVRIRAAGAKMRSTHPITTETAGVPSKSRKRVFQPGLADLFKALIVIRSAAHSVKILRNDRMIRLRQRKPIEIDRSVVAEGPQRRRAGAAGRRRDGARRR